MRPLVLARYLALALVVAACADKTTYIDAGVVDSPPPLDAQTGYTITITRSGNSTGTVTSSPAGLDCGNGCTVTLPVDTVVTLTAAPDAHADFTGWTGGECTGAGTCQFAVTQDVTIDAAFDLQRFTVDVAPNGNGTGTVTSSPSGIACGADCSDTYDYGTHVTLTAAADPGTTFLGWTGGGCDGTTAPCTFDVASDTSVQAAFALDNSVVVTLGGNGTGHVTSIPAGIDCGADCSEAYPPSTVVTLTAAATGDSFFEGWSGAGCSGTGDCVVTVDQAVGVTATFTLYQHTLDVAVDGTGTGTVTSAPAGIDCGVDCTELYDSGTQVVLTPTPSTGRFAGWTGGGCVGLGPCTVDLSSDQAVTATFDLITVGDVTSTAANGVYGVGASIPIVVTFSDPVVVTGAPTLGLGSGGVATYASGSGTPALTFDYTVAAGQNTTDLDYLSTSALALAGGTIRDAVGDDATLDLPTPGTAGSLGANKAIAIDTIGPTVTGVTASNADGTYTVGAVISVQVSFSEPVTVTGTPLLTLNSGAPAVAYAGGTGTSTLTFAYTVAAGQTAADLDYTATTALALNGGTIRDAVANNATLTLPAPGAAGSLGGSKAIVVDTTGAVVSSVTATNPNGTYGVGTAISIQVVFNEAVTVTGAPTLALDTGAVATYASGSGTPTLVFAYTVAAGQNSADLDYTSTGALALAGGTIRDAATNNATLTLPPVGGAGSLGANKNLAIDTTAPVVTGVTSSTPNGTYGVGAAISIQVAFSEAVTVTGAPTLALNTGGSAAYASGSGTSTLSFTYTVAGGQTTSDLDYASTGALALAGGTVRDAGANNATLTLAAPGAAGSLGAAKAIVVDTTGPVVTGVTSSTADGTYGAGAAISIQVAFSEAVTVTGTPTLALNTGATASYASGTGTATLTFSYTVAAGQSSADLDYTGAGALTGGTIRDGAANGATLTLPAPGAAGSLGANKAIVVDTTGPVVTGVTSSTANGTYGVGAAISIQVAFSEAVTVTGAPTLALNTGATAGYTSGSGTATLTFTYTIAAGQNATDLDYAATTSLALAGGTIRDAGGNSATLTLAAPGAAGSLGASKALVVDTAGPTVSAVTSTTAAGTYGVGAAISIQVTFTEAVTVTGVPTLALSTGATASYTGGSGTATLTFTYTVAAGQNATDLDYAATTSLALAGGTIRDGAANNATLTLPAPGAAGSLGANEAIAVDTTGPVVTGVTSSTANGAYGVGAAISIQVTFGEAVTVTGTPTLALNTGGVASYTGGSGTSTLTFTYTIAAGQNAADLDYAATTSLALAGGTIRDGAANNAVLTLPAPGAAGSLGANKAITVDTGAPVVTGVTSSTADGTYGVGAAIAIQVGFSEAVTVTGTPTLALNTGATAGYTGGSGTATLTFTYTVAAGQTTLDLDYAATTSLALAGGTIRDAGANNATLTLAAPGAAGSLGAAKAITIDTTAPTVGSVTSSTANGTYGVGAAISIQVALGEAVTVTGTPTLALNTGATAGYVSGSGTATLTFTYTVGAGQNTADLDYAATTSLTLAGGTIRDAGGNNATLTLPAPGAAGSLGANKAIAIDTAGPTVSSVTSSTANGTYGVGAAISIQVAFTEAVTVTGTPTLALNTGASASYASGTGTATLTFTYTVAAGQNVADLDYAATTSLGLAGGTIRDGAANNATLTLPAPGAAGSLGANKNLVIDTAATTVSSVTSSTANGTYGVGAAISIQVTFLEAVTVTGSPTLTVNTGGVATYAGGSGTATLTFTYAVAAGQNTGDLDEAAANSLALAGGTIRDAGNNNATLTLPVPGAAGSLGASKAIAIDTLGPVVVSLDASTTANGTYGVGAVIPVQVNFSEPVFVTGTPTLGLNVGTVAYSSGSGTAQLTFNYTVAAGQNTGDLDEASNAALSLNGGTLRDQVANNATLTIPAAQAAGSLGATKAIAIDTTGPLVSSVTSGTANGTYGVNAAISIRVNFNEAVFVTGAPTLTVNTGGIATFAGGSGTSTLSFTYTVQAGQNTGRLDEAAPAALALNGGTIRDGVANNANVTLPAPQGAGSLYANAAIAIDTAAANVKDVSSPNQDGTYRTGSLSVTVTFDEVVYVTGTPILLLSSGGVATYASGSGTGALTFTYVLVNGQNSPDLDESSTDALLGNGGTIRDLAGNNANLKLPGLQAPGSLAVNKNLVIDTGPVIVSVTSSTADGTYGAGTWISVQVHFNETIHVVGRPYMILNSGGFAVASEPGASTLYMSYTVGAGQASADLDYTAINAFFANGATLRDDFGTDATLTLPTPGGVGSLGYSSNIVIVDGITRWTAGSNEWPDDACNPTNSFALCNTNGQAEANAWATYECQHHGWSTGVWTGQKIAGCAGAESFYCSSGGATCTSQGYERTCQTSDQVQIEFTCSGSQHAKWDAGWSLAGVNYTDNNLSISSSAAGTTNVRTTLGRSGGKYYWEITATAGVATTNGGGLGIAGADWPNNASWVGRPASSFGFGYGQANTTWYATWTGLQANGVPPPGTAVAAGNVYMFAVDLDKHELWVGMNGQWWNNGYPEGDVGPAATGFQGTVYPAITFYGGSPNAFTANFGGSDFAYAVPYGFKAGWF